MAAPVLDASKRDFFVSFNRADRAWATWIAWVLEENGEHIVGDVPRADSTKGDDRTRVCRWFACVDCLGGD